jgi:hypothetical protein
MSWDVAVGIVGPHVVKIETPTSQGTGFLALYNADKSWCGIATAAHVVNHADAWQQPIKIRSSQPPDKFTFLNSTERVIFLDTVNDSAIILFLKGDLQLPEVPITLMPVDQPCAIGADVGWLGYPTIEPYTLCFFAGAVSAHKAGSHTYLIDGVAIHGVSGGPVFHCAVPGEVRIIGCVTAYHANRATGEALPGLLGAQDVSHFHSVAEHIQTIDEAHAAKAEFEASVSQQLDPAVEAEMAEIADALDAEVPAEPEADA